MQDITDITDIQDIIRIVIRINKSVIRIRIDKDSCEQDKILQW